MVVRNRTLASFDRRVYVGAALAAALIVFVGFARTYYLKGVFDAPPLAGALVHAHGVVMTLWFALFVVQTALVAAGRIDLHMRVGVLGTIAAALVVVIGTATAVGFTRRGGDAGMAPLVFLTIPLGDMLVFSALAGSGLLLRHRANYHKRLMLLASLSILPAAVSRIPLEFIETGGPLVFFGLTDLFILPWVAVDIWRRRRLHPAFGWGLLLIVASQPLRLWLGETAAWIRFADWLVG